MGSSERTLNDMVRIQGCVHLGEDCPSALWWSIGISLLGIGIQTFKFKFAVHENVIITLMRYTRETHSPKRYILGVYSKQAGTF